MAAHWPDFHSALAPQLLNLISHVLLFVGGNYYIGADYVFKEQWTVCDM